MRSLLALRARVLARRHATPLDALLAAATVALARLAGRELEPVEPAIAASALLAALAAAGAAIAHHQLYRARELGLLLAQPISARAFVFVRFVELTVLGAVPSAIAAAFVFGMRGGSPRGAVLAAIAAAPLLAGTQLLLAWALRRAILLVALVPLAVLLLRPTSGPGASLALLVAGGGGLELLAESAAVSLLALALVPQGHAAACDRLAARAVHAPIARIPRFLIPLPRASAALVQRDFVLIARGAFPRGALVLLALPAGLLVFREAALDRSLEAWQEVLAALMTLGVLSTVAAFLFAIDFPRARGSKTVLERALPVSGAAVLRARWFEAALPGVLLALALAAIAARGGPQAAERAPEIAVSGVLLALMVSHHGACFGLRSEAEGADSDLAVSAGYPIAAGTLVVLGACALVVHPLLALLYPLAYGRLGGPAARAWERAELLAPLVGGA